MQSVRQTPFRVPRTPQGSSWRNLSPGLLPFVRRKIRGVASELYRNVVSTHIKLFAVSLFGVLVMALAATAAPPPGYYTTADGKAAAALRSALHVITHNHGVIPYSSSTKFDTSDALKVLDQDPANTNNVWLLYAQRSEPKSSFGLTAGWNREHLWPNSYGLDDVEPAYSDLHNLRAEDAHVNSTRGNKYYDVSDTNNASYKFPANTDAPLASADSDSWQPPDVVKGDIARALFYMTIRYIGDTNNEPALILADDTSLISSTTNWMGKFSTLIKWHLADPVSPAESNRNNLVYSLYQTNRNPFVDRPEWVMSAFIPSLTLRQQATNIMLSWPANHTPTMLAEQTTNLSSTWTRVTNAPELITNTWTVAIRPEPGQRFFRLRLL